MVALLFYGNKVKTSSKLTVKMRKSQRRSHEQLQKGYELIKRTGCLNGRAG